MEEFILRVCYSAPGFLMAVCLHEYGRAWMSNRFGDNTAKSHGRLSLNPAVHYDLFGTIILPSFLQLRAWVFLAMLSLCLSMRVILRVFARPFLVSFAGPWPM